MFELVVLGLVLSVVIDGETFAEANLQFIKVTSDRFVRLNN